MTSPDLTALLERATPGPWDHVASDEHHGPYVTSEFGSSIADLYAMIDRTHIFGARDKRMYVPHMAELAEANAALIALTPTLARRVLSLEARLREIAEIADVPIGTGAVTIIQKLILIAALAKQETGT